MDGFEPRSFTRGPPQHRPHYGPPPYHHDLPQHENDRFHDHYGRPPQVENSLHHFPHLRPLLPSPPPYPPPSQPFNEPQGNPPPLHRPPEPQYDPYPRQNANADYHRPYGTQTYYNPPRTAHRPYAASASQLGGRSSRNSPPPRTGRGHMPFYERQEPRYLPYPSKPRLRPRPSPPRNYPRPAVTRDQGEWRRRERRKPSRWNTIRDVLDEKNKPEVEESLPSGYPPPMPVVVDLTEVKAGEDKTVSEEVFSMERKVEVLEKSEESVNSSKDKEIAFEKEGALAVETGKWQPIGGEGRKVEIVTTERKEEDVSVVVAKFEEIVHSDVDIDMRTILESEEMKRRKMMMSQQRLDAVDIERRVVVKAEVVEDECEDFEDLLLKRELIQNQLQMEDDKAKKKRQEMEEDKEEKAKALALQKKRQERARRRVVQKARQKQLSMKRKEEQKRIQRKNVSARMEEDVQRFMQEGLLPFSNSTAPPPQPQRKRQLTPEPKNEEKTIHRNPDREENPDEEETQLRKELLSGLLSKKKPMEETPKQPETPKSLMKPKSLKKVTKSPKSATPSSSIFSQKNTKTSMNVPTVRKSLKSGLFSKKIVKPMSSVSVSLVKPKSPFSLKKKVSQKMSVKIEKKRLDDETAGAPKVKDFVIDLNESDSDVEVEENHERIRDFNQRLTLPVAMATAVVGGSGMKKVPQSIKILPKHKLEEYNRLRMEIEKLERKRRKPGSAGKKLSSTKRKRFRGGENKAEEEELKLRLKLSVENVALQEQIQKVKQLKVNLQAGLNEMFLCHVKVKGSSRRLAKAQCPELEVAEKFLAEAAGLMKPHEFKVDLLQKKPFHKIKKLFDIKQVLEDLEWVSVDNSVVEISSASKEAIASHICASGVGVACPVTSSVSAQGREGITMATGGDGVNYQSPLQIFRSYRLSPYFPYSDYHSSISLDHSPKLSICRYDLDGKCNDKNCKHAHLKFHDGTSCESSLQRILLFAPELASVTEEDSPQQKQQKLDKFVKAFCEVSSKGKSPSECLCKLMAKKVSRALKQEETLHYVILERKDTSTFVEDDYDIDIIPAKYSIQIKNGPTIEKSSVRYFGQDVGMAEKYQACVTDNPSDVDSWMKLAELMMASAEDRISGLDEALSVLSRALEGNRNSEAVWLHYLTLYSQHPTTDDKFSVCKKATSFCSSYAVWWKCLQSTTTYSDRRQIIEEIVTFLGSQTVQNDITSHQILEILLYQANLDVITNRLGKAISCLKDSMESVRSKLSVNDHCLLWVCLIHLNVFGRLPEQLFDPLDHNPSHVVSKEPFTLFLWKCSSKAVHSKYEELVTLFKEAISACSSPELDSSSLPTFSPLTLHESLVGLHLACGRSEIGLECAISLSQTFSGCPKAWLTLASVYTFTGDLSQTKKIYIESLSKCSQSSKAQLCWHLVKFCLEQDSPEDAFQYIQACVSPTQTDDDPPVILLYRKILNLPVPHNIDWPSELPHFSQNQQVYIWLNYIALARAKPSLLLDKSTAVERYESAIHSTLNLNDQKILWREYFGHVTSTLSADSSNGKILFDLLLRFLSTFPSHRYNVYTSASWLDYSFHNEITGKFVGFLSEPERLSFIEQQLHLMPCNVTLLIWLCRVEYQLHPVSMASSQARLAAVLDEYPTCLVLWKLAMAISHSTGQVKETRWMLRECHRSLPFHASILRDSIEFELKVVEGARLKDPASNRKLVVDIIDRVRRLGINLEEDVQSGLARLSKSLGLKK